MPQKKSKPGTPKKSVPAKKPGAAKKSVPTKAAKAPKRPAPRPQAPKKSVVVTVADAAVGNIQQLADKLTAKGMKVDRVMPITGVVAGSVDPAKVPGLREVDGVLGIEDELMVHLPPPGAPQ